MTEDLDKSVGTSLSFTEPKRETTQKLEVGACGDDAITEAAAGANSATGTPGSRGFSANNSTSRMQKHSVRK